jgi:hypothetical protein
MKPKKDLAPPAKRVLLVDDHPRIFRCNPGDLAAIDHSRPSAPRRHHEFDGVVS